MKRSQSDCMSVQHHIILSAPLPHRINHHLHYLWEFFDALSWWVFLLPPNSLQSIGTDKLSPLKSVLGKPCQFIQGYTHFCHHFFLMFSKCLCVSYVCCSILMQHNYVFLFHSEHMHYHLHPLPNYIIDITDSWSLSNLHICYTLLPSNLKDAS